MVRKIFALAAAAVVLAGLGFQCRADTELRRVVPRDNESVVGQAALWTVKNNGQCSIRATPDIKIITQPSHGTVRLTQANIGIPKGSGCANPVFGVVVLYRPVAGFVGEDRFTYDYPRDSMVFNWVGAVPPGLRNLILTVR